MDKYRVIKAVGKGSFGKALLVERRADREKFVVKQINLSQLSLKERKEAENEVSILKSLRHPNIIAYEEAFSYRGSLCIVMEYADGGDLANALKVRRGRPLPEQSVMNWFVQICLALKHLHDRKILHRDLKTANVFVMKSGLVKLGDFGIAKVLANTGELAKTAIGTPYYLSPELCREQRYNNKSDIWSLGCILYELAALRHPFEGKNMRGLVQAILSGRYNPVPTCFSRDLRKLVSDMLSLNPRSRPSVMNILSRSFVRERIRHFLSDAVAEEELSHTVIHGKHAIRDAKAMMNQALVEAADQADSADADSDATKQPRRGSRSSQGGASIVSQRSSVQQNNPRMHSREASRPESRPNLNIARYPKSKEAVNGLWRRPVSGLRANGVSRAESNVNANRVPSVGINRVSNVSRQSRDKIVPLGAQRRAEERRVSLAKQKANAKALQQAKEAAAARYKAAAEARERSRQRLQERDARLRAAHQASARSNQRPSSAKSRISIGRSAAQQQRDLKLVGVRPGRPLGSHRAAPSTHVRPRPSTSDKNSRILASRKPSSIRASKLPSQQSKQPQQTKQDDRNANAAIRRISSARSNSSQRSTNTSSSRTDVRINHSSAVKEVQQLDAHEQRLQKLRLNEDKSKGTNIKAAYRDSSGDVVLSDQAIEVARAHLAKQAQATRRQKMASAASAVQKRVDAAMQQLLAGNMASAHKVYHASIENKASVQRSDPVQAGTSINSRGQRVSPIISPKRSRNLHNIEGFSLDPSRANKISGRQPAENKQTTREHNQNREMLRQRRRKELWAQIRKDQQAAASGRNGAHASVVNSCAVEIYCASNTSGDDTSTPSSHVQQAVHTANVATTVQHTSLSSNSYLELDNIDAYLREDNDISANDDVIGYDIGVSNSVGFEPEYHPVAVDMTQGDTVCDKDKLYTGTLDLSLSDSAGDSAEASTHSQDSNSNDEELAIRDSDVREAREYKDYVDMLNTMQQLDESLSVYRKDAKLTGRGVSEAEDEEWLSDENEQGIGSTGDNKSSDTSTSNNTSETDSLSGHIKPDKPTLTPGNGFQHESDNSCPYESNNVQNINKDRARERALQHRIATLQQKLVRRLGQDVYAAAHEVVTQEEPAQAAQRVLHLLGSDNIDSLEQLLELCMLETRLIACA